MRIEVPMLPKAGLRRCRARSKLAPPTPCRSRRFETSPSSPIMKIGRGRFRPVLTVPRRSRPAGAQAAVRGWSCAGSMAGRSTPSSADQGEQLAQHLDLLLRGVARCSSCTSKAYRFAESPRRPAWACGRSASSWTRATVETAPTSSILSPSIRSASSKHHGALVHSDSVKACQGD